MSRQETNNTFSEGLIKDLNPINTPNTALTDCVNGTIITYDGNEYSLQNDKGNYGLNHCKLKPNYIPVGVKEYGDILYIVSYNPLNEHVQIGSYPSPESITDSDDFDGLSSEDKIINIYKNLVERWKKGEKSFSYKDIVKTYSKLYIFYGADPDKLKMHEGDQIKLKVDGISTNNPFEKLQYVLVDDNRQITDISDKVSDFINTNDYKSIAWGPGWFGFKPVIAEISDNLINIKKMKVPSYGEGFANLIFNVRISTSDSLLTNLSTEKLSKLKVKVTLTGKENGKDIPILEENLSLTKSLDLKNGDFYYYSEDKEVSSQIDVSKYSSITLKATPILYLDDNIYIIYDHLERVSVFNLSTKSNSENFLIGEGIWNWKTDTANNSIALTFDTTGLSQTSVLNEDVSLQYSITGLNGSSIIDTSGSPYTNKVCSEWNMIGDTTIEFETTPFTKVNYENNPNKLYTENIYYITFKIIGESGKVIREFDPKIIVATELLNSSSEARYDKVPIDTWLNNYINSIKNTTFNIDYNTVGNWTINRSNPNIYNKWLNPNKIFKANDKTYSTFLSNSEIESVEENDAITWNAKCNLSVECKSDITLLIGPMWLDFNDNCQVQFNGNIVKFDKFTGKLLGYSSINVEGVSTKTIPCNLIPISQNNCIWNYEESNITYKELELTIDGYHFIDGNWLESANNRRKDLKLIFKLKSGTSTLWNKTWNVSWWDKNIDSTYYTDDTITISNILNALKNNDLGLIKINVGVINERNKFCGIGLKKTTSTDDEAIIDNDGEKGWDFNHAYIQFMVIKLNNDLLFIEIPDTKWQDGDSSKENVGNETITRFCSETKYVKTLDSYFTEGGFWKMILGDTVIKDSTSISINGKLLFPNKLIVGNFNLLNKSSIPENLHLSLDQYLFEPLILKSNKEFIDIKANFSSTDNEESVLRNSIEERNKSIESEYSYYIQDKKYASGFNSGILYESNGSSFINRNTLINYMNEKVYNGNTIIYGWDSYNDWGKAGTIKRKIGKIANEKLV